jgi:Secretion system C-terminal sorting domain/Glycogen recognition site of AMP-activated protein kinase
LFGINAQTNVTFQVDMNQQSGFTTPEVNGTFNNWCGSACNPLTDANGDGIWETTVSLAPGNYEYKFAADNWTTQETLLPGSPCTVTNFGYTNRTLTVGNSALLLPVVCWGSCNACSGSSNALKITVDLCGQNAQGVRLTGSFWNWTWNAGPVANNNGNGTWTFTLNPPPATSMDYLIVVDSIQENLITEMQNGSTCAPLTDYSSFANRVWTPGDPDSIVINYNRCSACPNGIEEQTEKLISIYPNPANDLLHFNLLTGKCSIEFIDAVGRIAFKTQISDNESVVNISKLDNGHYTLRIFSSTFLLTRSVIIVK